MFYPEIYDANPTEPRICLELGCLASQMVGPDDLPITSSESEFTASSGGEDVYELYE